MYTKSYALDDLTIKVHISRKKIKNLYLRVSADNKIRLSAPNSIDERIIDEFVYSKVPWIKKHYIDINNEKEILLLGKKYSINYFSATENKVLVLDGAVIVFYIDEKDKRKVIEDFLYKTLNKILYNYTQIYSAKMNLSFEHTYTIEYMRSKWGANYSKNNNIVYNKELIHRSLDFIEYVVVHELSHFKYRNHSDDFYRYVARFLPDYRKKRRSWYI